jgi:hypothetical protein
MSSSAKPISALLATLKAWLKRHGNKGSRRRRVRSMFVGTRANGRLAAAGLDPRPPEEWSGCVRDSSDGMFGRDATRAGAAIAFCAAVRLSAIEHAIYSSGVPSQSLRVACVRRIFSPAPPVPDVRLLVDH